MGSSYGMILTSPDGRNWTQQGTKSPNGFRDITFGAGLFVAVGEGGVIRTSSDAIHWTDRGPQNNTLSFKKVVSAGPLLFALVEQESTTISTDSHMLWTSSDGRNWTARNAGPFEDIAYGNEIFVAVGGPQGSIWTSTDGVEWSVKKTDVYNLYGVAYGNGTFVAVGGDLTMTSPDGAVWTKQKSGSVQYLSGIMHANGGFIAWGGNIYRSSHAGIFTSADGVTWTVRSSIDGTQITDMVYGKGTLVGVGIMGVYDANNNSSSFVRVVLSSVDAVMWTVRFTDKAGNYSAVAYGDSVFMVVGSSSGDILISNDGTTWTTLKSGTTNEIRGVAFADHTFTVVGAKGTILQSDPVFTLSLTANGASDELSITSQATLSVVASFALNGAAQEEADWWIAANSTAGWYYYVYPGLWYNAGTLENVKNAY